MISYINAQLVTWANAKRSNYLRGLGYASVCPMFRDMQHGGAYRSTVPRGVSLTDRTVVADMDAAVARLSPDWYRYVCEWYIVGGTAEAIAGRLGMSRRTLYDRLDALHAHMLGLLNDVAAGVEAVQVPRHRIDHRLTA